MQTKNMGDPKEAWRDVEEPLDSLRSLRTGPFAWGALNFPGSDSAVATDASPRKPKLPSWPETNP
jgi:hypothetical protein